MQLNSVVLYSLCLGFCSNSCRRNEKAYSCILAPRFCHKGIFCTSVLNLSHKAVRFVRETCDISNAAFVFFGAFEQSESIVPQGYPKMTSSGHTSNAGFKSS